MIHQTQETVKPASIEIHSNSIYFNNLPWGEIREINDSSIKGRIASKIKSAKGWLIEGGEWSKDEHKAKIFETKKDLKIWLDNYFSGAETPTRNLFPPFTVQSKPESTNRPNTTKSELINEVSLQNKQLNLVKRQAKVNFRACADGKGAIKFTDSKLIEQYQNEGYGIYFVVNNGGDRDVDVTECTALFAEYDDIPKDEQLAKYRDLMPTPTLMVDTGSKSIHAYWVFREPIAPTVWKPLQKRLLDYLGCDKSIKNPSRIMRLAGTKHQKTGNYSQIIEVNETALYETQDFDKYFSESDKIETIPNTPPTAIKNILPIGNKSSRWEKYLEDFEFRSEPIDLIDASAPSHRELINSGISKGSRDATGIELALDIIGTANYLDSIGQAYSPSAFDLIERYCNNCTPPLDGSDGDKSPQHLFNVASGRNPRPCLDEDKIRNIVAGIFWKREQPNLYTNSGDKNLNKVIEFPKNPLLGLLEVKQRLTELANQNLNKSDIQLKLAEISKLSGLSPYQVEKIYQELVVEANKDESLTDDISSILDAQESICDLETVTHQNLAKPLKHLAGLLNLRQELYLQSLMTMMATLVSPATSIVVSEAMGWEVSPNIFSGIVAPSSQKKSPILKAMITKPMAKLRKAAKDDFNLQKQEYLEQVALYQQLKKDKSVDLTEHFPNGEPPKPTRYKIYYQDNSTTEGIVNQLNEFPDQGTLLLRDELAGLFKSANAYRGGRGSDTEDLLKFYDGGSHTVLRAGGVSADIENVLLSVIGGVQPAILEKLLGSGDDDNGQWARFDFIIQPLTPSNYSDSNPIDVTGLIAWIYESINFWKNSLPDSFYLSREAKGLFKKAYDRLEQKRCQITSTAAMQHVYGKAEGKIAKYALQFHILNWLFEHNTLENLPNEISVQSIQSAIKWVSFLIQQVKGIYVAHDDNSGRTKLLTKIAAAAKSVGDWVTPKDVRNCIPSTERKKFNSSEIKSMFLELEIMGYGVTSKNGRTLNFLYQKLQGVQSVQKVSNSLDTIKTTSNTHKSMDVNQSVQSVQSFQSFGKVFNEEKNRLPQISKDIEIGLLDKSNHFEKNLNSGHLGHFGHQGTQTQSQQQNKSVQTNGHSCGYLGHFEKNLDTSGESGQLDDHNDHIKNQSVQTNGHSCGHLGHFEKNQDTLGESGQVDDHNDHVKNESVHSFGHLEKNQDTLDIYPDFVVVDGVEYKFIWTDGNKNQFREMFGVNPKLKPFLAPSPKGRIMIAAEGSDGVLFVSVRRI